MKIFQKSILAATLSLTTFCSVGATTVNRETADSGSAAIFDWFEYRGMDPVFEQQPDDSGNYLNPILSGFYPDPSIVQVGKDYYLVTSTFSYFPGIPVFHSRDLVNWTQIGNVIDRPGQLDFKNLGLSRGVFAPAISYHDGTFYLLNTCVDCGGNFVVTAKNPAGPWSDPVWLPEMGGIDPSLFFDDDGRAFIVNNDAPIGKPLYEGHRALWVQEFDADELKLIGPRKMIVDGGVDISKKPIWIEGPHFLRRNGQLYLIAAEGGTALQHSQVVFKSESVFGPFTPYEKNPILTQRHLDPERQHPVTSVGHADFVQDAEGNWWATFLGVRPYAGDFYNTGRETFLMPVRWENNWPVIARGDDKVPYSAPRPTLPAQPQPAIPTSGNFTLREEFDSEALDRYWLFLRQPQGDPWYDLDSNPGALTVRARSEGLGDHGRPSFIARRQQHLHAEASTTMHYKPARAGDRAGMAALQSDDFFYFFGLEKSADGMTQLVVTRRAGSEDPKRGKTLVAIPFDPADDESIDLRIDARGDRYDFRYRMTGKVWTPLLLDADGTPLSTKTAGGFVGAVFGVYAYRDQAAN